ncbi:hypothetical protein IGI04_035486, partial [Brassica rapa subsp. trilocularis]
MFRLHFAYMSPYQAFGAQKGVFRVVIGRARHGATSPERHHQVALTSLLERPYQSDREKSLAVSSLGDARTSPERPPGATPRSRSHLTPLSERPPKATPRGRSRLYGETTRSEAWSDLSERPTEVAPEGRSDLSERHAEVAPRLLSARFLFYLRAFWSFHYAQIHKNSLEKFISWVLICYVLVLISYLFLYMINLKSNMGLRGIMEISDSILDHPRSNPYAHEFSFPLVKKVEGLEGQEELCFINNNGSWYKKEPHFQYNNYQQKSYPNNQQSGYPPRNNQQGSYQPQQNPSSGSFAPQESSTDTLLKQILESQTRSEKQVGYELKNFHSKIDGSYNELNNKFSHLASTSLKPTTTLFELNELNASCSWYLSTTWSFWRHLGAFGAQKGVFRVVIGRARHGATSPERHHQVALTSLLERPYQSDREKSLAVSSLGDARTSPERPPGATPRSRSHLTPLSERPPKATPRGRSRLYGETTRSEAWSDLSERLVGATCRGRSAPIICSISILLKGLLSNHNASSELATQLLILRHFSPESLILDHPRSNPYAHEFSFPLVKK